MKKLPLFLLFINLAVLLSAAPFKFLPHSISQPDGTTIKCYVSGDEYFNWIHDDEGYTIIQDSDGYYYYATKINNEVLASNYKVNSIHPSNVGIEPWVKISKEEYLKRKKAYEIPAEYQKNTKAPHTGDFNNVVIYIRFSGESEISTTRETYDNKLNPETGYSLKAYFNEVSYNQLNINSTHYPSCAEPSTTNASYEDPNPRGYFQPYNATTNPNGYETDTERRTREHQLLVDAVEWVNANHPIPDSINLDGDSDGYVDNVCFMINNNSDGWSDLLWAHRWSLYSQTVRINGKRVWDYTFQPENQVSVRTLCHEMFHALGAPDLYHYYEGTNLSPAGSWDLMEHGSGHMGAYMKWKYAEGNWIREIPEINSTGTYTLSPLTADTNNCYMIASPNSREEYFVVEYRKKSGEFESNIPGEGLLVYRINTNFDGNASYDFDNEEYDEVYIYRPNGQIDADGNVNQAHFNSSVGRTIINDETNPSSFLSDGSEGGLSISEISQVSETITFKVNLDYIGNPVDIDATANSETQIDISWNLNSGNNEVLIANSPNAVFGVPENGTIYSAGEVLPDGGEILYYGSSTSFSHSDLTVATVYHYKIWSKNGEGNYSGGVQFSTSTLCGERELPYMEDFSDYGAPACWEITDNAETGGVWEFNNPADREFGSTTSENGFAILDSENYGPGNTQNSDLITSSFDFSNIKAVQLSFEHYYKHWDGNQARLMYSVNNGVSWMNLESWNSNQGSSSSPKLFTTILKDEIAGESNVMFKWNYTGSYGYYWMIDDLEFSIDTVKPSVEITSEESDLTEVNPFEVTITFDKIVSGFTLDDIIIETGQVDTLYTEDSTVFIAEISSIAQGLITIDIPASVAVDQFVNENLASEQWSIDFQWPLSVEEMGTSFFSIYPNPSNGDLNINFKERIENTQILIYDISGKVVYDEWVSDMLNHKIDLSNQKPGYYFIQVVNDEFIENSNFILE